MYLCIIKLTSRKFSTAHSIRKFEENAKCHWECLFWNKRKKCNKKQSITLMGTKHQMEWTENLNRLKCRNGGGWMQLDCTNEQDHLLADRLTSQSTSVGCKCLLMYRSSLCTSAVETTAKCQERKATACNSSNLQLFKSSCNVGIVFFKEKSSRNLENEVICTRNPPQAIGKHKYCICKTDATVQNTACSSQVGFRTT